MVAQVSKKERRAMGVVGLGYFARGGPRLTLLRPKTALRPATVGWNTALARRKPVPDQKAWRAVPPRSVLMMGRATARVVASKATARTTMIMEEKARTKSRVGLKSAVTGTVSVSASASALLEGLGPREGSFLSEDMMVSRELAYRILKDFW